MILPTLWNGLTSYESCKWKALCFRSYKLRVFLPESVSFSRRGE